MFSRITAPMVLAPLHPQFAEAHGTHGILHVITLHWLPWIGAYFAGRPWLIALVVAVYFAFAWMAYRRVVAWENTKAIKHTDEKAA